MRFLHIADLHLGKQMNDISLMEDQQDILNKIAGIAERESVQAVLIAGDVYQRSAPQAEAMALFDAFVSRLAGDGIRVFVISGNHDSALRISYFSSLIQHAGVYVTEAFDGNLRSVSLTDGYGETVVWMMPFLRPSQVRRLWPEEKIRDSGDAVAAVLRRNPPDPEKRNVLIAHQFVAGCETSDSEERMVGGLDEVDAGVFSGYDYVALGHIHKPQRVGRDSLRYAGSPLKYSFSEADHRKSVTLVEMGPKGETDIRTIPLQPLHEVRRVEGMLEEIQSLPYSEDYVWVTVHDEIVPPDARVTVSVTFPNMMMFSVVNSRTKADLNVTALQRMEEKSIPELFADFYALQNNEQTPTKAHMRILGRVLRELEEKS